MVTSYVSLNLLVNMVEFRVHHLFFLAFFITVQGRRNLMRKGVHLRTQYLDHK